MREGRLEGFGDGDDNRGGVSDQLRELVCLMRSSISRLRFFVLGDKEERLTKRERKRLEEKQRGICNQNKRKEI